MRYIFLLLCSLQMGLWMNNLKDDIQEPDSHIQILIDEHPLKEEYDHQPILKVYVEETAYHEAMKVFYFNDDQNVLQEVPQQWEKEQKRWRLEWRFPQDFENTYIQVSKDEQVYFKSQSFAIRSPLKDPVFQINDSTLLDKQKYTYASGVSGHVMFTQKMNSEKTILKWMDKDITLVWNEQKTQASFLFDGEGDDMLQYTLVDVDGNQKQGKSTFSITIDQSAPVVQIFLNEQQIDENPAAYYGQKQQLKVVVNDNTFVEETSHVFINEERISSNWRREEDGFVMDYTLEDGDYTLSYDITDQLHHRSKALLSGFTIDTQRPKIQLMMKDGIQQEAGVHVEVTDANIQEKKTLLHVQYQGNEAVYMPEWQRKDNTLIYDGVFKKEGSYQFYVSSIDAAGNQEKSDIHTFVVDHTPPKIAVKVNKKQMKEKQLYVTNRDVQLEIDVVDEHLQAQTFTLYKNGSLIMQEQKKQTFDIVAEKGKNNTYDLLLHAIDQAGNQIEKRYTFAIHQDMPAVRIANDIFHGKASSKSWKPSIEHESENYRVIHTVLRRNYQRVPFQWGEVIEEEGFYTLEITVEDAAGNQRRLEPAFSFSIDKTPPQVGLIHEQLQQEANKQVRLHDTFLLMLEPYDTLQQPLARFTYISVNGVRMQTKDQPYVPITFDQIGTYHIEVGVEDEAGNKKDYEWMLEVKDEPVTYQKVQKPITINKQPSSTNTSYPIPILAILLLSMSAGLLYLRHVRKRKN